MRVCIIHTYATVVVLDVEDMAAAERELAYRPEPCHAGYEIRVEDPKPRIIQNSGWPSAYRKDLSLDQLQENWTKNQGKHQKPLDI